MSTYLPDSYLVFETAHNLTELIDQLATAFQIAERPSERRSRLARTKLIRVTLTKRPGLYVTELYRELSQFGHMKVTYPTIWSDVRTMEKERALLTVGGPQGTPR